MLNLFTKKKEEPEINNVYALLDKELHRMHSLFNYHYQSGSSKTNLKIFYDRIRELQDAMLQALEKQPANDQQIKDLQNTVAEIILLTETESK